MTTLGTKIRTLRGNRKLREIAQETGLSVSHICDLEKDRCPNSALHSLNLIAIALGVTLVELLSGVDDFGVVPGYEPIPFDEMESESA